MAAYCQVYGVIHFTSPAGWLPVYRDQLRAQRSVTSMGKKNFTFLPPALWDEVSAHRLRDRHRGDAGQAGS